MHIQRMFNVYSMYIQCIFNISSTYIQRIFNVPPCASQSIGGLHGFKTIDLSINANLKANVKKIQRVHENAITRSGYNKFDMI